MPEPLRILFVADIVGRSGRGACCLLVPRLRRELGAGFAVVNGENVTQGAGISPKSARMLLDHGADVLTSGNHIWRRPAIGEFMAESERLLRPANHHRSMPGRGWVVFPAEDKTPVGVLNVQGRAFMEEAEHPFDTAADCVETLREKTPVILVDFHAEATSEKVAMAIYLDGRVSAVIGTHTHVQTSDERILPGGTAAISDAGMTGPCEGVIGVDAQISLRRFLTGVHQRFEPAEGLCVLEGVLVTVDPDDGRGAGDRAHPALLRPEDRRRGRRAVGAYARVVYARVVGVTTPGSAVCSSNPSIRFADCIA